jgi:hypothetical protein
MKTVKEFRDEIIAAGGVVTDGDYTYHHKEGGDVDIKEEDNLIAYIPSHRIETKEYAEAINPMIHSLKNVGKLVKLAKHFNLYTDAPDMGPMQVVETFKENPDTHRLGGMVEAYEKLLIGRGVTIAP